MLVLSVIVAGLVILRGLDAFDQVAMMRLESFCKGFGGRDRCRGRTEVDRELEMKIEVRVKRRTINRRLVCFIVHEFCERQEIHPIILLIIAIDVKILFNGLIHTFSLTISLGVECCR